MSHGDGNVYFKNAPLDLEKLHGRPKNLPRVAYLSLGPDGRYYCRFTDGSSMWDCKGDATLTEVFRTEKEISCVAFGADRSYYVLSRDQSCYRGLCTDLEDYISAHPVRVVALHPTDKNCYLAFTEGGGWMGTIDERAQGVLNGRAHDEYVKSAWLGKDDTYLFHIVKRKPPKPPKPQPVKKPTMTIVMPADITTLSEGNRLYVGQVLNGARNGSGTTTYGDGFHWKWFSGQHANGSPSKGLVSAADGGMYSGECLSPTLHFAGWGSLSKGECWSSGQFNDGKLHGVGLHVYDDGRWTMGWFENGKRHGRCLTFYSDSEKHRRYYLGDYHHDDYATSTSKLVHMSGSTFTGNAKDWKGATSNANTGLNLWKRVIAAPSEVKFLEEMVAGAFEFMNTSIPDDYRSKTTLNKPWRNTSSNTSALKSFIRGWRLLKELFGDGFVTKCTDGWFTWHGNGIVDEVNEIVMHGFDTEQRSRQNHGPGEYAATSWQAALPFAVPSNRLILCYSLPGPFLTTHGSFCTVTCNPPSSKGVSFMLPVATVQFTDAAREVKAPSKLGVWQFLWEGTGTGSKWHPYHPVINDQLTALSDAGGEHIVSVEQRRHDDSQKDVYEIHVGNFQHKQINTRTNYKRSVKEVRQIPAYPTMRTAPAPLVANDTDDDDGESRTKQRRRRR